jgi:hypothetical protein
MQHKFGDFYEQRELVSDIRNASFVVAHNWQFEAGWVRKMGVDLRTIIPYDTMLAEWVFHAGKAVPNGFFGLNATADRYGVGHKPDLVSAFWKLGFDTPEIPHQVLLQYCENDVLLTERVMKLQRERE